MTDQAPTTLDPGQMSAEMQVQLYAMILQDLHSAWVPHDGQIPPIQAIFKDGRLLIFVECGRKFGKTELVLYILYRVAMTRPNSQCYYIAPFQKQASEIIWASNRIQGFLPTAIKQKYGIRPHNTQKRVFFDFNGSFIKLDGADSEEDYRGINPAIVVYEEFKDHKEKFHTAMEPNLLTHKAPLVIIGTGPETDDNLFCQMVKEAKDREDGAYFNFPSWANPHISKDMLIKIRENLIARGEHHTWLIEYAAQRVRGGKRLIFPMYDKAIMVKPHVEIMKAIEKDAKRGTWQCIADPASSSVFGVLFRFIHPYTKVIYRLDELYVDEPAEMTTRKMWKKIYAKILDLYPRLSEWNFCYDEAAAWFSNEMVDVLEDDGLDPFDTCWVPTQKSKFKKDDGINLMRDQMLYGKYIASDRCTNLNKELNNYIKDDKGRIVKVDDHLIDCDRYGDADAQYSLNEREKPKAPVDTMRRGYSLEEEWAKMQRDKDWAYALDQN